MSGEDLIKRGDIAGKVLNILNILTNSEKENKIDRTLFSLLYHSIGAIAFIPSVQQQSNIEGAKNE